VVPKFGSGVSSSRDSLAVLEGLGGGLVGGLVGWRCGLG